ncbi:hypothetical protein HPO96_11885 [Kribbella sandramycini]|uniref:DUF5666 domain-containing protein n=1 Tax=Kribbella sandramycini TaxID=60450 RepID=A0A7Y4KYD6_9ACTN|nr:DUF5666 domain-containing protein [Kribbella sandramycini]MBB6569210.1 hypothetical protein [Kribbella sandramycini]NOL40949.1 hypothetical protein [Kribbella sandramycini]
MSSNEEFEAALKPKQTVALPVATAVLAGIVVLALGLAGGAGLHAALATESTQNQAGRGPGGYGGFRGQGQGQGPGAATVGTVVSATDSQLVVKTQTGEVTVKLTGETTYDITAKGTASDLKAGEQVVVNGQDADGQLTATTVRQGGVVPGNFRSPGSTPTR